MAQIFKAPRRKPKKKQPTAGARYSVTVDSLDHQGKGVARHDGKVLFIEGALPQEQCEVIVSDNKGRYAEASLSKIIEASDKREQPFCEYYGSCGGCQTQHAQPDFMLACKQQAVGELLSRVAGIEQPEWVPALKGPVKGYRRKTRLAVDARNQEAIRVGFRGRKSNAVVDIQQCSILTPALDKLLKPLNSLVNSLGNPKSIGHITLIEGEAVVQVTFRIIRNIGEPDRTKFEAFAFEHGVQVLLETAKDKLETLSHKDSDLYYLADDTTRISIGPNDFIQVNGIINRKMVEQAREWLALQQGDVLLDLFCGAGNFSLPLAKSVTSVTGIEGVAKMVQKAQGNALQNSIANASFECADINATDASEKQWAASANKVLLDPAREGAEGVVSQIVLPSVSHILYVSCNPATFARDAKQIVSNQYQLKQICLMDMFPNTAHTELMALFVRNN